MYDTEPESCDPGRLRHPVVTVYRCLTCGWRGKGSMARAEHWHRTQHPLIVPKDDQRFTSMATERKAG